MQPNVYDQVRYSNYPYAQTHPDRLATVAILYGLAPPDPFNARVLEVGCGAGGNLMAMAAATPGIHAVGVDLAAEPIAEARAAAAEIGLRERRVPPRRRACADRSFARRVRLHRRPRRLRLDPRGRPRRAAGADRGLAHARPASRTSPTTRSRAATSDGCCATPGSGMRAMSRATTPPALRRRRSCSCSSMSSASPRPTPSARCWGVKFRYWPRVRSTGSCTTTSASIGIRSGSPSSPSMPPATSSPTSARPTCTACAPRCSPRASRRRCGGWPAATGSRSRTTATC